MLYPQELGQLARFAFDAWNRFPTSLGSRIAYVVHRCRLAGFEPPASAVTMMLEYYKNV